MLSSRSVVISTVIQVQRFLVLSVVGLSLVGGAGRLGRGRRVREFSNQLTTVDGDELQGFVIPSNKTSSTSNSDEGE